MLGLPHVFSLLPSTKIQIQRVFNTVSIALFIAVAHSIQWLVLIVLAIVLDFAVRTLIRSMGFAPDIEEVFSHIPRIYAIVLVLGITAKSTWDLIAIVCTTDKWELPRKKE